LKAISEEVGTGLIKQGKIQDIFANDDMQWQVLDIKLKSSVYFEQAEEGEEGEEDM